MGLWLPFEGVQGANPLHNLEFAPAEHMGQIWQWTRTQLQLQLQPEPEPEPEDPSSAGACVQRLTLKLQPRCMPPSPLSLVTLLPSSCQCVHHMQLYLNVSYVRLYLQL